MVDALSARNRIAAKQEEVSKIREKAKETAKSAMTDGFIRQVQAYARADAKRGDYMSSGYIQLERAQMRKYVSPDRSGPMAQVNSAIQETLRQPSKEPDTLFDLLLKQLSGDCSGRVQIRPEGQSAEVRAPNGEVIASYSSLNGGWTEIQTKAELKFQGEAASVYAQAFKEARAEMKASSACEGALDVRA